MPLDSFKLSQKTQALADANLLRHLKSIRTGVTPYIYYQGQRLINFSSNDYLGLAQNPEVAEALQIHAKQHGVGSGASHLVSGHFEIHEQLECKLAEMTGYESAMLFSSGFMANIGVIPALINKNDRVFQDRLNHASLIDGARLSKAERHIYEHLDCQQLHELFNQTSDKAQLETEQSNKLIITDHVFSMDGTVVDMQKLSQISQTHDVGLLIDDAHGFGLYYGQSASSECKADIYMGTLGKAIGTYGAFVAGSQELITYLKTKARSFVFTTALPSSLAAATLKSLAIIEQQSELQTRLKDNIALLRQGLSAQGWQLLDSNTAIQPVIIGGETETLSMAEQLREAGFWVIAIRPPTVPAGTCRLRITLSASHTQAHIMQLLDTMQTLKNNSALSEKFMAVKVMTDK